MRGISEYMRELVRGVGGLLTIITLNVLIIADVLIKGASLSTQHLQILVVLVGALLGLDIMFEKIPASIEIKRDASDDGTEGDN